MNRTKREISSGGIIYRKSDDAIEVAIASRTTQRGKKVWCLPKGWVEKGESLEETAQREVKEETGLNGEIVGKIGDIQYWFYSRDERCRIFKTVHFFLLTYLEGDVKDHDFELDEVRWVPLEEAEEKLSFKTEKDIMRKAREMLKSGELKGVKQRVKEAPRGKD